MNKALKVTLIVLAVLVIAGGSLLTGAAIANHVYSNRANTARLGSRMNNGNLPGYGNNYPGWGMMNPGNRPGNNGTYPGWGMMNPGTGPGNGVPNYVPGTPGMRGYGYGPGMMNGYGNNKPTVTPPATAIPPATVTPQATVIPQATVTLPATVTPQVTVTP